MCQLFGISVKLALNFVLAIVIGFSDITWFTNITFGVLDNIIDR